MRLATDRELEQWRQFMNETRQWHAVKKFLDVFYPTALKLTVDTEDDYDDEVTYTKRIYEPQIVDRNGGLSLWNHYDWDEDEDGTVYTNEQAVELLERNGLVEEFKRHSLGRHNALSYVADIEVSQRLALFPGSVGEQGYYKWLRDSPPVQPNFALFVE